MESAIFFYSWLWLIAHRLLHSSKFEWQAASDRLWELFLKKSVILFQGLSWSIVFTMIQINADCIFKYIWHHQKWGKIHSMNFRISFWTTWELEIYSASSGRWRWLKVTLGWEATPGEANVVTTAPVTIRIQKWPCQCQLQSQERWCQAGWSLGQDTWQAYQCSNNIWNTLTAVEGGWGVHTESYLKIIQSKHAHIQRNLLSLISMQLWPNQKMQRITDCWYFWAVIASLFLHLTSILSLPACVMTVCNIPYERHGI